MGYPIDNSTDPPLRDICIHEVEEECGPFSKMSKRRALDVLYAFCAPHWLRVDKSDLVLKALITRAGISNDLDALANFGLEEFYVAQQD